MKEVIESVVEISVEELMLNIKVEVEKGMKRDELLLVINDMSDVLVMLESKICGIKKIKKGRKDEVKELLLVEGRISIDEIGKRIGISNRNVSSILSYLRDDGLRIGKDSLKRLYIEVDDVE